MPRQRYATALVTGASSGIGWEFAKQLADRGVDLVVAARRKDRLEQLAKELSSAKVEVLAADLTTDAGVSLVEDRIASAPIELLVNNAGVSTVGPLHEQEAGDETRQVALNVVALHRLTHAAVKPMVEAGHGGILQVSSIAGEQPLRGLATYSASKAFVTRFSEALHAEVKAKGVHVTVLKPGYVWTEMNPGGSGPQIVARPVLARGGPGREALPRCGRGRPALLRARTALANGQRCHQRAAGPAGPEPRHEVQRDLTRVTKPESTPVGGGPCGSARG
jgi:hypothetical protein